MSTILSPPLCDKYLHCEQWLPLTFTVNYTWLWLQGTCFGRSSNVIVMMLSWHGNTFHVTGPFWGESIGHRWIPLMTGPVMQTFDEFFLVCLNKLLNKESMCWWHEMPQCTCDITLTGLDIHGQSMWLSTKKWWCHINSVAQWILLAVLIGCI